MNKLIFLFCLIPIALNAQIQVDTTYSLRHRVFSASINGKGEIFLANAQGELTKISARGDTLLTYSPVVKSSPTLVEAWDTQKIFVFFQETQQWLFLDRFLSDLQKGAFSPNLGFVALASLSADNMLWVINSQSLELMKYNMTWERAMYIIPIQNLVPEKADFKFLRAYQNQLFLLLNNQIISFDQFGNYQYQIDVAPEVAYFSFEGNSILYASKKEIVIRDLYTQKAKRLEYDSQAQYQWVLKFGNQVFALTPTTLSVFSLN